MGLEQRVDARGRDLGAAANGKHRCQQHDLAKEIGDPTDTPIFTSVAPKAPHWFIQYLLLSNCCSRGISVPQPNVVIKRTSY